jgi:hypothetical protein
MRPFTLLLLPTFLIALAARAETLLVDTTSDEGSPGFQVCDADPGNANCSLRGAISRSNAQAGLDTIAFDLSESDPGYVATTQHWRISPATEFALITDDLVIDGYTQSGALANTNTPEEGGSNAVLKIELHGPGTSAQTAGLYVGNGSPLLTVRGLAINLFRFNLQLSSPGLARVEGCFIGTDISGMQAADTTNSSGFGIRLQGPLLAGDGTPATRNVISGNSYIGVWDVDNSGGLTLKGNLIGTNATGTAALPGQDYGIYAVSTGHGALIGGSETGARNLVSGNTVSAIAINAQVTGANPLPYAVVGNYIGTDVSGTLPIGNGLIPPQPTIVASSVGSCGLQVGGTEPGEGNLIAFGGGSGVSIQTCDRAAILGNRFMLNRGIAIDLSDQNGNLGATPNDPGDADANPPVGGGVYYSGNRLQNYPEIVEYSNDGANVTLTYRVDTDVANATYPLRIDIARGRAGQAEFPLAIDNYEEIDAGLPKSISFPLAALEGGGGIVLSATDSAGNTSEQGGEHLFADDFE